MLGTVALDQQACLFELHPASVHVCSTFSQPAAHSSLLQCPQTYLPLCMFDYVALDQHTCLKPSSYVSISFKSLTGMLQYPCFKHCFEPTAMFVAVAPDDLVCLLHLPADMFESVATDLQAHSVVVWLNQQVYMLHLPQTRSYVPMLVPN